MAVWLARRRSTQSGPTRPRQAEDTFFPKLSSPVSLSLSHSLSRQRLPCRRQHKSCQACRVPSCQGRVPDFPRRLHQRHRLAPFPNSLPFLVLFTVADSSQSVKRSEMLFVSLPDPPLLDLPDDWAMTAILSQLARLASLSTREAWNNDSPPSYSQRNAKLWYEWAEACIRAIPPMSIDGNDLWTMPRRKLYHWLVLKLQVLEYASRHLSVLAVDIANHIVRL